MNIKKIEDYKSPIFVFKDFQMLIFCSSNVSKAHSTKVGVFFIPKSAQNSINFSSNSSTVNSSTTAGFTNLLNPIDFI